MFNAINTVLDTEQLGSEAVALESMLGGLLEHIAANEPENAFLQANVAMCFGLSQAIAKNQRQET